ncbi:hypothetical protein [Sporosarcina koreensis]|uniref:Uncharacterized protein n=1 Tax=Sporosarcina koreensis TaxID=334735 RepID=A0ABW0TUX4_9BACL
MGMFKINIFLICFCVILSTSVYAAENEDSVFQEVFLNYQRKVLNIINIGVEPLKKFDGVVDDHELYDLALSAEHKLAESSRMLSELKIPIALPDDTKTLLGRSKEELTIGLKSLSESMNYFVRFIENPSPPLYDNYIVKRDKGINYVHGGLTTLTTAKLQLDAPDEPTQIVQEILKTLSSIEFPERHLPNHN